MLASPVISSDALCALSLRAIKRGQKPHLSLDAIRMHRAFRIIPVRSGYQRISLLKAVKTPPPAMASVEALSRYFESRCKPEDFREAKGDRDYNNRKARKYARA